MKTLPLLVLLAASASACDSGPESNTRRRAGGDLPGFDVRYSKIATSLHIEQNFDPDSFLIEFQALSVTDWKFSSFDRSRAVAPTGFKIAGKGVPCFFAESDIDLVTCESHDSAATLTFTVDDKPVTDKLSSLFVSISRVEKSTLVGAPQSTQVTKESSMLVEAMLSTDKLTGEGVVHYPENFGGTTVR